MKRAKVSQALFAKVAANKSQVRRSEDVEFSLHQYLKYADINYKDRCFVINAAERGGEITFPSTLLPIHMHSPRKISHHLYQSVKSAAGLVVMETLTKSTIIQARTVYSSGEKIWYEIK